MYKQVHLRFQLNLSQKIISKSNVLVIQTWVPELLPQFTTKNHLKLDVLLNQTTRPDLLQSQRTIQPNH